MFWTVTKAVVMTLILSKASIKAPVFTIILNINNWFHKEVSEALLTIMREVKDLSVINIRIVRRKSVHKEEDN